MGFWVIAMLAYPETQARAHAELDAVVGRTRLPTFADHPHLPYIRAMVKELLRWRPIAPLITPHRVTEDDWYDGMFIPKGTICLANAWHMNRVPEIYGKNTDDFDPARYLDASGDIAPGVSELKKDGHFTYGFGKRNCVGRHMADNSLFINITTLLWATKMERKKDASGHFLPLDVDGYLDDGLVMLAGFIIQYRRVDANVSVSVDVRSHSRSRSHHVSQRLLECSHRNVSCEDEVVYVGRKKSEFLDRIKSILEYDNMEKKNQVNACDVDTDLLGSLRDLVKLLCG